MTFRLHIRTDNAAFEGEDGGAEVARILRELALRLETHGSLRPNDWILRDLNGNTVGRARIER